MLTYIQPEDIARRLVRAKPFWFHGAPKIHLLGDVKTFGDLSFNFGDQVVTYRVYIKDYWKIMKVAAIAVGNFAELCRKVGEDE